MSKDAEGDVGGNGKGSGAPRRWLWFLLGLGTPVVVAGGLWLGWYGKVHKGAKAKLERAENAGENRKASLEQCQNEKSRAERRRDKYKRRTKVYKRAYKKLKRRLGLGGVKGWVRLKSLASKGRAWGFIDERGKVVIPGRFLSAEPFVAGLAVVQVKGKYGYVDSKGKLVIPARFERARSFLPLSQVGTVGVGVDAKNARALAAVELNGRYGVIDRRGTFVLKPSCNKVEIHPSGMIQCEPYTKRRRKRVRGRMAKKALYRGDGSLVIRARMFRLKTLADNRLAVRKGKRWGYVDSRGKWVIPATFKRARAFHAGFAAVRRGKVWGFIDGTGKVVVALRFDAVRRFGGGLAPAKKGHLWGYVDRKGRWVVKPRYKVAKPFEHGLAIVDQDGRFYHCLTITGSIAGRPGPSTPDPKAPRPFQAAGKWGYRDGAGTVTVAPRFQWAGRYFEGRARVQIDAKWGYVDLTGKLVIPATHTRAHGFSQGRAAVWVGSPHKGAYALIDRDGKIVVPARFHWVGRFAGGFALATIDGADALIDRTGRVFSLAHGGIGCNPTPKVSNIGFTEAKLHADAWERPAQKPPSKDQAGAASLSVGKAGLRPQKKDGRYGYVDRKGRWVIPPLFERAGPFRLGRAVVLFGGGK